MTIDATVDPDLKTVRGTLVAHGLDDATWVDPLADMPEPPNDLQLFRTYPGRPDAGAVTWTDADGVLTFEATLPRRYGAVGAIRRHGLFASGAWYPQPLVDDALPTVQWEVTVRIPQGTVAALGDGAGREELVWHRTGERAPLAVLPRGGITHLAGDGWTLDLVHRRRHRLLQRELVAQLDRARPEGTRLDGVAVVAPLRRRLVRPAPGLAYVSDRAYRLTPGLQRFHRVAVTRGVATAMLPLPDPYIRDVAGAGLSETHARALKGDDADRLLRRFQWVPLVNGLLSSRRMPFYSDVLELTHPADPVLDDLTERFGPTTPGTVVAAQLDDTFGDGTVAVLGTALAQGIPVERAAELARLEPGWLDGWRRPYPVQDYTLAVTDEAVHVTRDAPADAPVETVIVKIDGTEHVRTGPAGSWTIPLATPARRVVIDPARHVAQISRVDDAWPRRYQVTASAGIASINLTRLQLSGSAWMSLRKQWDTRNLWTGGIATNRTTLVGLSARYRRKLGTLLDGWTRPLRAGGGLGLSVWSPWYAEVDVTQPGVSSSAFVTYDDRVSGDFPLRGKRAALDGEVGVVPATGATWAQLGLTGGGLLPLHPRHVIAARIAGDVARSDVPHRLLAVGNPGVMVSVPALPACNDGEAFTRREPCARLADLRSIAGLEYRTALIRNASVPLAGLGWGNELQLAVGIEGLAARLADGDGAWATGATVGISGVGDVLGAEPMLLGITAGWPLLWAGLDEVRATAWPELYIRWGQRF